MFFKSFFSFFLLILTVYSFRQTSQLIITTPAFLNNTSIPSRYSLDGGNVRPELDVENIPKYCDSLAVLTKILIENQKKY